MRTPSLPARTWSLAAAHPLTHPTPPAGAAFGFFHDLAVTESHYVFLENPIRLDLWRMATQYAFSKACLAECLQFDRSLPARVHLIPRPGRGIPSGGRGRVGGGGGGGGGPRASSVPP